MLILKVSSDLGSALGYNPPNCTLDDIMYHFQIMCFCRIVKYILNAVLCLHVRTFLYENVKHP